jgi:hypothetical protein
VNAYGIERKRHVVRCCSHPRKNRLLGQIADENGAQAQDGSYAERNRAESCPPMGHVSSSPHVPRKCGLLAAQAAVATSLAMLTYVIADGVVKRYDIEHSSPVVPVFPHLLLAAPSLL